MSLQTYPVGLAARVRAILLRPTETWTEIAAEPATVRGLFTGYVMSLAAIDPVCAGVGRLVFGERALGAVYRPPILAALIEGVIGYGLALASVWALAVLIQLLATPFDGVRDRLTAFKVAAYASTAGWLAGVVYLVPALGALALIGQLYTLYLLYRGVEILLRPRGRTLSYVALVVVSYIVVVMLAISLTKLLGALA